MTDSQMGKVKYGHKLKAGRKQVGVGVLFITTYYPRLKKIAQIMKKLEHLLHHCILEKNRGSHKCGNLRCLVCNNTEQTDTFTSFVTSESFKINHHICCNDKLLIYLLICKVCKKRYTGKTVGNHWWKNKYSHNRFILILQVFQLFYNLRYLLQLRVICYSISP